MFWKAKHNNPIELYKLFKTLSSILDTFKINICNDGISILQMDNIHVSVLDIFLDKDDFSEYEFSKEQNIVLNSENFCKALSLSEKIDSITFSLKNEHSNKLDIIYTNESRKSKMSLHLIEPDNLEISTPNIDYNIELDMSIGRFNKICKNLLQFGSKNIKFKSNSENQEIIILGESDMGNIEIILKETNKKIKRKVNIKKKINNGFELETKEINSKKEIIINKFVKNITSTFCLEYINKILSMSYLSSRVNIGLSEDTPIEIQIYFFKNSYLNYYIAPKIDDI